MSIRLYHFAPAHMVKGVMEYGLTRGAMPLFGDDGVINGFMLECQWLTKDGDPQNQHWATQINLDYDRTAYRLTVKIPESRRRNLLFGKAILDIEGLPSKTRECFEATPGHENWAVYFGCIPARWIKKIQRKSEDAQP